MLILLLAALALFTGCCRSHCALYNFSYSAKEKVAHQRSVLSGARICAPAIVGSSRWKMVYEQRVGVDRTAGETFPENFVSVFAESKLADGVPTRAVYDGVSILLVRRGQKILAMGGDVFSLQWATV